MHRDHRRGTAARERSRDGRCRCPSACTASSPCARSRAMPLTLWVPALALGELPVHHARHDIGRAARGRRSPRGSSTEPAAAVVEGRDRNLSRRPLPFSRRGARRSMRNLPGIGASLDSGSSRRRARSIVAALGAGDRALDQQQARAPTSVRTTSQVLRGHPLDAR
jgi:hypothetical protein